MNFVLWTGCWSSLSLLGCSAGQGHGRNRHAHQKKKKKLDRAKWCGEWGTILYGNPKGALALKIEVSLGKKYTGQIMKPVSRCAYSPQTVTCKLILKYIQFTGPASNYVRQFCQC